MLKELDVSQDALWKQRFRTPVVGWSQIASQNSDHGLVCTNRDGIFQLYAWHVPSGDLTQLTHHSAGVVFGVISADGQSVYYLDDKEGNEIGHFVNVPFAGGTAQDLTPDMPDYASWYITESHSGNVIGLTAAAREWGFRVYVIDKSGKILFTYENGSRSVGPNLSHDGTIAVIATNERSGSIDMMLEAYDIASGNKLGELYDGDDVGVDPIGFVPKAGDEWYLAKTSKTGFGRPVLWHPRTGERRDLELPQCEGEIEPWDWSEDGRYLLLREINQAQYQLYLYDLQDDVLITLDHPAGTYSGGYFAGDDLIYVNMQDSQKPSRVVALDMQGNVVKTVFEVGTAPDSAKWQSVNYPSGDDTSIQAWLVTPEGDAPYPTIVHTHGGPTAATTDNYSPAIQAWVDHGFAVFSINYRGSTTFGKPFEKSIYGNLGELEVNDIEAGVHWLIDNHIAQPDMILKTGGSYGGYLTLLALGKAPELWAGGMAVVAIADWTLMYEDQAETLRSYQKSLFGGAPDEMPEQMAKSSPITYVEQIKAPIQVIQGENDTRCPSRQMHAYEEKMTAHNKHIEIEWFNAGHGSREMEQSIKHQELQMRFAYRVLG
ncbi:MAG: prolyl oligopeptidase family serine peptidase [Phototrophicaceae bacterium]